MSKRPLSDAELQALPPGKCPKDCTYDCCNPADDTACPNNIDALDVRPNEPDGLDDSRQRIDTLRYKSHDDSGTRYKARGVCRGDAVLDVQGDIPCPNENDYPNDTDCPCSPPNATTPSDGDTSVCSEPTPDEIARHAFWRSVLESAQRTENLIDDNTPEFRGDEFWAVFRKLQTCIYKLESIRPQLPSECDSQPLPDGMETIPFVNSSGQQMFQRGPCNDAS